MRFIEFVRRMRHVTILLGVEYGFGVALAATLFCLPYHLFMKKGVEACGLRNLIRNLLIRDVGNVLAVQLAFRPA